MLQARCRRQWELLGIRDPEALKRHIKAVFEKHDHQEKVLIALYRMVLPDWERIKTIKGYPEAGNGLWQYICRNFQEFDRRKHPDCLPAGAWMNWGFSINRNLSEWEVSFENCSLIYKS